jgi:dTDP-4-dehydrorhamnose reductase
MSPPIPTSIAPKAKKLLRSQLTAKPRQLATETGRRGIPLGHISTDYVRRARALEQDNPLNAYGRANVR